MLLFFKCVSAMCLDRIVFSTGPSLFVTREIEEYNRSLFMRRVSFLLLIGEEDQYVRFLPELEAKMMEFFRLSRPQCHYDFFSVLCGIFVSFKKESLYRFFPISFSVLLRLLKKLTKNLEEVKGDELKVFLGACKFLDLFLCLPYDETQSMRWLFISDPESMYQGSSLESPYYEENHGTESRVLEEKGILSRIRDHWMKTLNFNLSNLQESKNQHTLGMPFLHSIRSINQISDLAPFILSIEDLVFRSALSHQHSKPNIGDLRDLFLKELVTSNQASTASLAHGNDVKNVFVPQFTSDAI